MTFANIRNNEIIDFNSMYLDEDITRVETTQEIYELYKKDPRMVIYANNMIIENPEYISIELQQAKENKIAENDNLRDIALDSGVTYKNVLFDSDTDQKINLLATYERLADGETITWFGKDNQGLTCTKEDLIAIGDLIVQLHRYCWQMNAYIKHQINQAQSVEEVQNIVLDYSIT